MNVIHCRRLKHKNIRDNLFVVNAVMNSVKKGYEESLDICAYNVEKCFDSLWTHECINNLYLDGLIIQYQPI